MHKYADRLFSINMIFIQTFWLLYIMIHETFFY